MNTSALLENQFLATKFYVPIAQGAILARPRLTAMLTESFKYPLTLISAPAGFGKTTLLSAWAQSYSVDKSLVAWVSLDQEDNEPQLFWAYMLSALNKQRPEHFTSLLTQLQSPQGLSLKHILTGLINLLVESWERFVLILDDYQVITNQQVHSSLSYLIEHLPTQLSIILATRADPPLSLPQLRARQQILEVRTDQLRCTAEETKVFLHEVMDIQLSDETIQQVTVRTEGWLVGLQLLGLSLAKQTNTDTLLEISGDQRYILDYLTEIVLQQQPHEIQTFLLSTCILERLTGSLCDAVMQQTGSLALLKQIEQANLFLVSLDSKREWYRYHALFAEALRYRLEQANSDLVLTLHHRASLWYAQHDQTTQAIMHAFCAQQWQWAADLIEQNSLPLMALTWGASEHQLVLLQQWLEQLPAEVMTFRPRLCLACVHLLWTVAPYTMLDAWFKAAETGLIAVLTRPMPESSAATKLDLQTWQEQKDLLGEVMTWRAYQQSFHENGEIALILCQQALSHLSPENAIGRALVALPQLMSYYTSNANDAVASVANGLQGGMLAQEAGHTTLAIILMGITAKHMIGAGRLHEAQQLTQQAMQLGEKPGGLTLPDVGWPAAFQAEILREWNQLDAAHALAQEALTLCQQTASLGLLIYVITGYAVLLRISLSCGDLETAHFALQQVDRISMTMNQPIALHFYSLYTTVDQVRLWLASGKLDQAVRWIEKLDLRAWHGTPFTYEREEIARIRVLLAKKQPRLALKQLDSVLLRATTGQRWGHVIEIQLLQALTYQMLQEEAQALHILSQAIELAEPEGYIRSFLDEGMVMEALLYRLRKQNRKQGSTPYLDRLLAAFQQESRARIRPRGQTQTQPLPDPLSLREREVLQLIARGASNQEIGQELVIVSDTVKRHVSRIFTKLGVQNRVQAVKQARELGLLDQEN